MAKAEWGTILHASGGSWNTLCRPGRDRGPYTFTTTDERKVTCRACLRVMARRTARAPASADPTR